MRVLVSTVFLLAAMPLAAQTPPAAAPPPATANVPRVKAVEPPKKAEFMFVQTATSGTFAAIEGTNGKRFRLSLSGVSPETIYFSDRPERIVGSVEMGKFVSVFPFGPKNPPNAAIVLSAPKSQDQDVLVVELTRPVYDAARRTLTYEVAMLPRIPNGLSFYGEKRDGTLPASFHAVSVFIDDCPDTSATCYGSYQCSGGGEDQQCCRVGCGDLGYDVGQCWNWFPPGCSVCHDYSAQCNNGPCNGSNPFCLPNQCGTGPDCS